MKPLSIAIVGAGLGGLSLASLLGRAGHHVRVYEQAASIGEVGAGLSIPPNAARIIDEMGLLDQLRSLSNVPERGRIYNGRSGRVIKYAPFGEVVKKHFGEYYYQLHRADMIGILLEGARRIDPDTVMTDHVFERFEETPKGVRLFFENQPDRQADILIGADGIRSRIRSQICGPEAPVFTGYVAWRALIPMDSLPDYYKVPLSNVWIGKGRNITFYPIRGNRLLNCAIFASDQEWASEDWNVPAKVQDIRTAFSGYHQRVQTLIDAIPEDDCFKWGLFGREPTGNWSMGKVVLMGDAAHPMLPFLGQGASMAIEDASALARAISTQPDFDSAARLYLKHREERANWVLMESRAAGERFVSDAPNGNTFGKDGAMKMNKLFGYKTPEMA